MAIVTHPTDIQADTNSRPLWHRSAPRRLVDACGGDARTHWTGWQKHLARRKRPVKPPFLAGKRPPLWWVVDEDFAASDFTLPAIYELLSNVGQPDEAPAWFALAAAYALPAAAASATPDLWWDLTERLRSLAGDAALMSVDRDGNPRELLRQQLLAGELPLALSYLFPELESIHCLRSAARAALSEALVEWTDGQGMLHGRLLPVLGPLWASWTRCRWMGERLKRGCWSREAEVQYQWLVRHAVRLTGLDGQFMLGEPAKQAPSKSKAAWPAGLYRMALQLVGDRADCAAADALLPKGVLPKQLRIHKRDLPDVSLESEWAGVAVLATDWKRSAVRLALNYADEPMRIELAVGRKRLLAGLWSSQTTCDGEPVRFRGEWEQACWQTDDKCDYLELCTELSHGLRLERQVLLSRTDRVLYLADVVISADGTPHELTHSTRLPIGPGMTWQPEEETRDGVLASGKLRAAMLPLALSEWRSDPRGGRLEPVDEALGLSQQANGRAMYCPLLIDLDSRRAKKDRTWRQLTVGEALEAVARDVAVGFRANAALPSGCSIARSHRPATARS